MDKLFKSKILSWQLVTGIVLAVAGEQAIANYERWVPFRWHEVIATDGDFKVLMPGEPENAEQRVPTTTGTTIVKTYTSQPVKTNAYVVMRVDVSDKAPPDNAEFFDSVLQGGLSKIQGTLVSKRDFVINGIPVREAHAVARGNSGADFRFYRTKRRMYALMAVSNQGYSRASDNLKFMNSFSLIP